MQAARSREPRARRPAEALAWGANPSSRTGWISRCTRASFTSAAAPAAASRAALLFAVVLLCSFDARAELLAWDGTLALDFFGADPRLRHWELAGPGAAVSEAAPPALGALHVAGGISATTAALVTDPDTVGNSVAALQVSATLGIGTLSPFPPLPFGELLSARELPLFGCMRLCLFTTDCIDDLPILSFFQGRARALGVGGTLAGSLPGGVRISLQAAPWTLGTATLAVETTGGGTQTAFAFGFVHGAGSASGSTGASGGEIQLVTPMLASSGASGSFAGLSRLRLRFVPEPGRLMLLAAGSLLLLALARRRARLPEKP